MAFPASPTNGQTYLQDNVLYTYSSANNAWTVTTHTENTAPTFNYYTSSGSFTIPNGAKALNVVVIGAGGGGGGGSRMGTNYGSGGGGGGGGFSERMFSASELGGAGTVVSYTVGSGGTAGPITATGTTYLAGNAATDGGTSSFGTFLVAEGGKAGLAGAEGLSNNNASGGSGMWRGNTSPNIFATTSSIYAGGGAGGGGGFSSEQPQEGGVPTCTSLTAATSPSQAGSNNTSYNAPAGGGHGASTAVTPIAAGAGGLPGGGGGGGGRGGNTGEGGAGGAGGGGLVAITVWYG